MGIPCHAILKLPYANQFKLLAGESGLSNEVQWVHYLEEPRYAQWLRGGELIVLAGVVTGDDDHALCALVHQLFARQVAGVAVSISEYIPQVPPGMRALCDRLGLPLFEVPAHVRILDISQSICFAIFQRRQRSEEIQVLLRDLLYGKRLSEQRLRRLKDCGIDQDSALRVVLFQLTPPSPALRVGETSEFYEEEREEQYLRQAASVLEEALRPETHPCWLTVEEDAVLWLTEEVPQPRLNQALEHLRQRLPELQVRAGVSEVGKDLRTLRQRADHARKALALHLGPVVYYEDLVLHQLLGRVESKEELGEMAGRILGDLLLPENRDLLKSLRCYIDQDCSAKQAAETLFLHVNTFHYRLKKIESILHRRLDRMEDRFDVMLALKLEAYYRELD